MKNYQEITELITSKGKFYIDLSLDRIQLVLSELGNPQEKVKCIQVAGTNGKGSVCAILSSILTTAGYKTGLFTSPHIFDYTERIKINDVEISKEDFVQYASKVLECADSIQIPLTEFEILTAVMFEYFLDMNVDVVIIETGLGGRFDATNVVSQNLCSIITHIDLDHTDKLGDTKDKIAFEKAGIIKSNCPLITSEGYEAIRDKANEQNSLMVIVNPYVEPVFINALSLKGIHQQENLALAIAAIRFLFKDIDDNTIMKGLERVKHIGRFQYIENNNVIIDGAHNPDGIRMLNKNLDYYFPDTKKRFIFGCLETKDYKKMLAELFSFSRYEDTPPEIYFYEFKSGKSCSFNVLKEECIYYSKELYSIDEIEFSEDILTVICGSLYMINELIDKETLYN